MIKPAPLDPVDRALLQQLQADATATHQALAEAVGVSTATCHRRIQRLRAEGLIERTVSILSPAHLKAAGLPQLQAIVEVTLDVQTIERLDAFEAQACADPEVQQVYRVSPGPDFVLVVCVADMDAYQAFARRLLSGDAHVRNVRSYFVTSRPKLSIRLPI